MLTEIAYRAEIDYRQQRFLDEARSYRLAKQARSTAPARRIWLPVALTRTPRHARHTRPQSAPVTTDGRGSANCAV